MKRTLLGFCLYYVIFTVFSIVGTLLGWSLQIPMAIAFLLMLYCSTVGRTWMEESKARAGQTSLRRKEHPGEKQMPKSLFTLLLILPPLLYLVIYAVVWSLL